MNSVLKKILGVSFVVTITTLMAFSSTFQYPVVDITDSVKSTPANIEDIYFSEDCSSCRFITIYDENDHLVYDKLIIDAENIQDPELKVILEKSYFLMKNSITDYYILSK